MVDSESMIEMFVTDKSEKEAEEVSKRIGSKNSIFLLTRDKENINNSLYYSNVNDHFGLGQWLESTNI